ncbi:MAG TPA: aminotransferase class V-fold PLP-dependent enzyme [Nitriliruptorales bacterium]|nr:aminotransferase class V-fold PLP-dependent enzyme [Nitriliruptorales bacterium]
MKEHFTRFLHSDPERLHVAAHSHHPWPDVSFEAHQRAWLDAAALHDDKWDRILDEVLPEARAHVARQLGLPDPTTIVFAPNTHSFVLRLLSCLPRPTRILTTSSEFHSFSRQTRRLEEDGLAQVEWVPLEPFADFPDRLAASVGAGGHHLVFVSQVFFDSGYALPDPATVVGAVPDPDTFVVLDGYHGFMALPTDLGNIADRAFYLAGGYKYAMAGEGAVFLHAPPGYGPRPTDTGWFAAFGHLERGGDDQVTYPTDARRFAGSTFDPSGVYRFNAVQRWLAAEVIGVADIHAHVRGLQRRFLDRLADLDLTGLTPDALVPGWDVVADRGHFLTFRVAGAERLCRRLRDRKVIADRRRDRVRFGFGIYHDDGDVDLLCDRLLDAERHG